jgi:hypothetical protein
VGTSVGTAVGIYVNVGTNVGEKVGLGVGSGQISSSVSEQVEALALHALAPQHAKGVGAAQATHDEISLMSAGPTH